MSLYRSTKLLLLLSCPASIFFSSPLWLLWRTDIPNPRRHYHVLLLFNRNNETKLFRLTTITAIKSWCGSCLQTNEGIPRFSRRHREGIDSGRERDCSGVSSRLKTTSSKRTNIAFNRKIILKALQAPISLAARFYGRNVTLLVPLSCALQRKCLIE